MSNNNMSRSEWSALSIQDRIRAMNDTLDDVEVQQQQQGIPNLPPNHEEEEDHSMSLSTFPSYLSSVATFKSLGDTTVEERTVGSLTSNHSQQHAHQYQQQQEPQHFPAPSSIKAQQQTPTQTRTTTRPFSSPPNSFGAPSNNTTTTPPPPQQQQRESVIDIWRKRDNHNTTTSTTSTTPKPKLPSSPSLAQQQQQRTTVASLSPQRPRPTHATTTTTAPSWAMAPPETPPQRTPKKMSLASPTVTLSPHSVTTPKQQQQQQQHQQQHSQSSLYSNNNNNNNNNKASWTQPNRAASPKTAPETPPANKPPSARFLPKPASLPSLKKNTSVLANNNNNKAFSNHGNTATHTRTPSSSSPSWATARAAADHPSTPIVARRSSPPVSTTSNNKTGEPADLTIVPAATTHAATPLKKTPSSSNPRSGGAAAAADDSPANHDRPASVRDFWAQRGLQPISSSSPPVVASTTTTTTTTPARSTSPSAASVASGTSASRVSVVDRWNRRSAGGLEDETNHNTPRSEPPMQAPSPPPFLLPADDTAAAHASVLDRWKRKSSTPTTTQPRGDAKPTMVDKPINDPPPTGNPEPTTTTTTVQPVISNNNNNHNRWKPKATTTESAPTTTTTTQFSKPQVIPTQRDDEPTTTETPRKSSSLAAPAHRKPSPGGYQHSSLPVETTSSSKPSNTRSSSVADFWRQRVETEQDNTIGMGQQEEEQQPTPKMSNNNNNADATRRSSVADRWNPPPRRSASVHPRDPPPTPTTTTARNSPGRSMSVPIRKQRSSHAVVCEPDATMSSSSFFPFAEDEKSEKDGVVVADTDNNNNNQKSWSWRSSSKSPTNNNNKASLYPSVVQPAKESGGGGPKRIPMAEPSPRRVPSSPGKQPPHGPHRKEQPQQQNNQSSSTTEGMTIAERMALLQQSPQYQDNTKSSSEIKSPTPSNARRSVKDRWTPLQSAGKGSDFPPPSPFSREKQSDIMLPSFAKDAHDKTEKRAISTLPSSVRKMDERDISEADTDAAASVAERSPKRPPPKVTERWSAATTRSASTSPTRSSTVPPTSRKGRVSDRWVAASSANTLINSGPTSNQVLATPDSGAAVSKLQHTDDSNVVDGPQSIEDEKTAATDSSENQSTSRPGFKSDEPSLPRASERNVDAASGMKVRPRHEFQTSPLTSTPEGTSSTPTARRSGSSWIKHKETESTEPAVPSPVRGTMPTTPRSPNRGGRTGGNTSDDYRMNDTKEKKESKQGENWIELVETEDSAKSFGLSIQPTVEDSDSIPSVRQDADKGLLEKTHDQLTPANQTKIGSTKGGSVESDTTQDTATTVAETLVAPSSAGSGTSGSRRGGVMVGNPTHVTKSWSNRLPEGSPTSTNKEPLDTSTDGTHLLAHSGQLQTLEECSKVPSTASSSSSTETEEQLLPQEPTQTTGIERISPPHDSSQNPTLKSENSPPRPPASKKASVVKKRPGVSKSRTPSPVPPIKSKQKARIVGAPLTPPRKSGSKAVPVLLSPVLTPPRPDSGSIATGIRHVPSISTPNSAKTTPVSSHAIGPVATRDRTRRGSEKGSNKLLSSSSSESSDAKGYALPTPERNDTHAKGPFDKHLLVLMSSQSLSRDQVSIQQQVETILNAQHIPYEELDGAIKPNREKRNELFNISGIWAKYPQFFVVTGNRTIFWGDWETLQERNENGTLLESFMFPSSHSPMATANLVSIPRETPEMPSLANIVPTVHGIDDKKETASRKSSKNKALDPYKVVPKTRPNTTHKKTDSAKPLEGPVKSSMSSAFDTWAKKVNGPEASPVPSESSRGSRSKSLARRHVARRTDDDVVSQQRSASVSKERSHSMGHSTKPEPMVKGEKKGQKGNETKKRYTRPLKSYATWENARAEAISSSASNEDSVEDSDANKEKDASETTGFSYNLAAHRSFAATRRIADSASSSTASISDDNKAEIVTVDDLRHDPLSMEVSIGTNASQSHPDGPTNASRTLTSASKMASQRLLARKRELQAHRQQQKLAAPRLLESKPSASTTRSSNSSNPKKTVASKQKGESPYDATKDASTNVEVKPVVKLHKNDPDPVSKLPLNTKSLDKQNDHSNNADAQMEKKPLTDDRYSRSFNPHSQRNATAHTHDQTDLVEKVDDKAQARVDVADDKKARSKNVDPSMKMKRNNFKRTSSPKNVPVSKQRNDNSNPRTRNADSMSGANKRHNDPKPRDRNDKTSSELVESFKGEHSAPSNRPPGGENMKIEANQKEVKPPPSLTMQLASLLMPKERNDDASCGDREENRSTFSNPTIASEMLEARMSSFNSFVSGNYSAQITSPLSCGEGTVDPPSELHLSHAAIGGQPIDVTSPLSEKEHIPTQGGTPASIGGQDIDTPAPAGNPQDENKGRFSFSQADIRQSEVRSLSGMSRASSIASRAEQVLKRRRKRTENQEPQHARSLEDEQLAERTARAVLYGNQYRDEHREQNPARQAVQMEQTNLKQNELDELDAIISKTPATTTVKERPGLSSRYETSSRFMGSVVDETEGAAQQSVAPGSEYTYETTSDFPTTPVQQHELRPDASGVSPGKAVTKAANSFSSDNGMDNAGGTPSRMTNVSSESSFVGVESGNQYTRPTRFLSTKGSESVMSPRYDVINEEDEEATYHTYRSEKQSSFSLGQVVAGFAGDVSSVLSFKGFQSSTPDRRDLTFDSERKDLQTAVSGEQESEFLNRVCTDFMQFAPEEEEVAIEVEYMEDSMDDAEEEDGQLGLCSGHRQDASSTMLQMQQSTEYSAFTASVCTEGKVCPRETNCQSQEQSFEEEEEEVNENKSRRRTAEA